MFLSIFRSICRVYSPVPRGHIFSCCISRSNTRHGGCGLHQKIVPSPFAQTQHDSQASLELLKLGDVDEGIDAAVTEHRYDAELKERVLKTDVCSQVVGKEIELLPGPAEDKSQANQDQHPDGLLLSSAVAVLAFPLGLSLLVPRLYLLVDDVQDATVRIDHDRDRDEELDHEVDDARHPLDGKAGVELH